MLRPRLAARSAAVPQGTPAALSYPLLRRLSSPSPSRAAPRSAWLQGAPAGGGGTQGRHANAQGAAGPVGWRKKCFKLPSRCFKLPSRDAMAVVDPELCIHGIAGLCVADAAIMPTVVSSSTNAATIMIGERVADLVREKLRLAA